MHEEGSAPLRAVMNGRGTHPLPTVVRSGSVVMRRSSRRVATRAGLFVGRWRAS
jgi:hypothetical protein